MPQNEEHTIRYTIYLIAHSHSFTLIFIILLILTKRFQLFVDFVAA